jgi:hypothetical protein
MQFQIQCAPEQFEAKNRPGWLENCVDAESRMRMPVSRKVIRRLHVVH